MIPPEVESPVVIVMLKAPRLGSVKTRLASAVGDERAAVIYQRLVEHQLGQIPGHWPVEIHFAPEDARDEMQRWLGARYRYIAQSSGDLGRRLTSAFEGAFKRGAAAVVAVGGDCPSLDQTSLLEAGRQLCGAEVVLGPAIDGGYYLIGLRQLKAEWFRDIPWSTAAVWQVTMDRLRAGGVVPRVLPTKEDVDDLASWRRARVQVPELAEGAGE